MESLPDEALVCVFSFIGARDLILHVSAVCSRFRRLIISYWYWRRRYMENYHGDPYIIDDIDQLSCMQRGGVHGDLLREACSVTSTYTLDKLSASAGGLDSVKIIHPEISGTQAMVVAGSRDFRIYIWRKRSSSETVSSTRSIRKYITADLKGHNGWVWCLASASHSPNILCSGSWDHDIKLWDIRIQDCMTTIRRKHKSAVLSLLFPEPAVVISGCYDKLIRNFDIRSKDSVSSVVLGDHMAPVLSLADSGNYLYSGSEDRTVKLWDKRSPNVPVTKVNFDDAAVTSVCYSEGILSAAVGKTVHFFNAKSGQLLPLSTYQTDHKKALTTVRHNTGILMTGSKDGTCKLVTMSQPHTCLKVFEHFQDITDVDFSQEIFAVASSDRSVSLWTPKQRED
jgi:WD40 repeat protein